MNEKNFRNETPYNMDDKGKFDYIFHHIWEAASMGTNTSLDRLDWLIKTEKYTINQKTLVGLNTPLHFAVIHENLKAIDYLCRYSEILLNEKNSLGYTPSDLAMLIPKRKTASKIVEFLSKKI
jgi:hypothetical protein